MAEYQLGSWYEIWFRWVWFRL